MGTSRIQKLHLGQTITFRKGKWPNQLVAKGEVTEHLTRSSVQVQIKEVIKTDIFWWRYQVGRELTASFSELSKPS